MLGISVQFLSHEIIEGFRGNVVLKSVTLKKCFGAIWSECLV